MVEAAVRARDTYTTTTHTVARNTVTSTPEAAHMAGMTPRRLEGTRPSLATIRCRWTRECTARSPETNESGEMEILAGRVSHRRTPLVGSRRKVMGRTSRNNDKVSKREVLRGNTLRANHSSESLSKIRASSSSSMAKDLRGRTFTDTDKNMARASRDMVLAMASKALLARATCLGMTQPMTCGMQAGTIRAFRGGKLTRREWGTRASLVSPRQHR